MIIILGLTILIAEAIARVADVLGNSGTEHALTQRSQCSVVTT